MCTFYMIYILKAISVYSLRATSVQLHEISSSGVTQESHSYHTWAWVNFLGSMKMIPVFIVIELVWTITCRCIWSMETSTTLRLSFLLLLLFPLQIILDLGIYLLCSVAHSVPFHLLVKVNKTHQVSTFYTEHFL